MEWSRIEPRPGEFDAAALALERERVVYLRRLGIEPVVTLHHFTHPRWFQAEGGWEMPGSVARFARFARAVAEALSPEVSFWVTINEPIVLLLGGYLGGLMPPGRRAFSAAAKALEHMLRAHAEAAAAIREANPAARVGIAHNMLEFAPDRPDSGLDRRLAQAGERLYNRALIEAIATGDVDWQFPGEGRAVFRLPDFACQPIPSWASTTTAACTCRFGGVGGPLGEYVYRDPHGRGLTETGWEVRPEGFDGVLCAAARIRPADPRDGEWDRRARRQPPLRLSASPRGRPGAPARGGHADRGLFPLVPARQLRVAGGLPPEVWPLRGGLRDVSPGAGGRRRSSSPTWARASGR